MAITYGPMSVRAGVEFAEWTATMRDGVLELVTEGTVPAFTGLHRLLGLTDRIREIVRDGAEIASRTGRATFTVEVPFTEAEQRFITDMGDSLLSYIEVLALQGKIDSTPSPAVLEAMATMAPL